MTDLLNDIKKEAHKIYDDIMLDDEQELTIDERTNQFIDAVENQENELIKWELYQILSGAFDQEAVEKLKLNHNQKQKRKQAINRIKELTAEINENITVGNIENALNIVDDIEELKNDYRDNKKVPSFSDFLLEKQEKDKNRTGNLLGYKLNKFFSFCKAIDGLQAGFYLIAAYSNIGKTALLCNLALDVAQSNNDVKVLYFSLDDSRNIITNRMLSVLSNVSINLVQKKEAINRNEVIEAYETLNNVIEIVDSEEIQNITQLETKIRINYKSDKNIVAFVDGLYNLDVKSRSNQIRDLNIERANKIKRIVDIYKIPLLTTGEIGKNSNDKPSLKDVMESGKYIYNANLVLMLSEHSKTGVTEPAITLKMDYAKNKLSYYKGSQYLVFTPSNSKILQALEPVHQEPAKEEEKGWG